MFYSQIILAKKGPLEKVWLAAHWGDKKLPRPQVFAVDIHDSVDAIVHPQVPLALRLSGHLLLGVVRIYSRKVKFLVQDSTDAMNSLKEAFSRSSSNKSAAIDLPITSANAHTLNVSHFGEFLLGAPTATGVQAFDIPVLSALDTNQDDWVPADLHAHLVGDSPEVDDRKNDTFATTSPQQEWVAFDPDDDDDSEVSDIEMTRAARESRLNDTDTSLRRASVMNDSKDRATGTLLDDSFPLPDDPEEDMAQIPFDDDDDAPPMPEEDDENHAGRASELRLSSIRGDDDSLRQIGLDDTLSLDDSKKRKRSNTKAKMKKRRKLVYNQHGIDATKKQWKGNNLTRPHLVMPAPKKLTDEQLLSRPALADDGLVRQEVLELFECHTRMARGLPLPYGIAATEAARGGSQTRVEEEDDPVPSDEEDVMPMPDDDDDAMPMPDDDEAPPSPGAPLMDEDEPVVPQAFEDMDGMSVGSGISLGLVNEQEEGATQGKWHKHTQKVYHLLQKRLKDDETLSYANMSKGCSRRTAAGVFFELLQLKTWDYVDLDQAKAYGDIVVSQGPKFDEAPPS